MFHHTLCNTRMETRIQLLRDQALQKIHTSDNITEILENTLQEWRIKKEQQVSITTDMLQICKRLGGLGRNLNLAITKILKNKHVEAALRACRHLVQGFSGSWKRELKAKLAALELKSLIIDP